MGRARPNPEAPFARKCRARGAFDLGTDRAPAAWWMVPLIDGRSRRSAGTCRTRPRYPVQPSGLLEWRQTADGRNRSSSRARPPSGASRSPGREALAIGLLLGVAVLSFTHSVSLRKPWFCWYEHGRHQWLTASTLKFSRIWYHERPWTIRFAMLENPLSAEFRRLTQRRPYVSYPP